MKCPARKSTLLQGQAARVTAQMSPARSVGNPGGRGKGDIKTLLMEEENL